MLLTRFRSLITEQSAVLHCAYGSAKDISVYAGLGLRPDQIYIVGKAGKKQQQQATVLADGCGTGKIRNSFRVFFF